MNAGIPYETPAWIVNQLCGSGLRAVALGYQAILNGDAKVIVAGGQESMSQAPHAAYLRAGQKMGALEFTDTMLKDGLIDAFHGYHMGVTAENVAQRWQITREMQDKFAVASQNKAEAARKSGRFRDEIVPVAIKERKGEKVIDTDEFIRDGVTYDGIAGLKPAFQKDGTVTAANASGINDGAAALVLMSAKEADIRGIAALARIASWATVGVDPRGDGLGPDPGIQEGAGACRLDGCRPRSRRGQRGVRRAGLRREQGYGLGPGQGERQRRRHRHRPSHRRLGRARARHPAA